MKPVIFDPEAKTEVTDALGKSSAADEFRGVIDAAISAISANPQRAARIGRAEIRQYILPRPFPFSIVYAEEPDLIRVLAFAHHKRRPGYWKRRLRPT